MPISVEVNVTSGIWLRAGEEAVVRRIAKVVVGHDHDVRQKSSGYKWDVHGNEWWTDGVKDNKLSLHYRYGTPELEKALAYLLNWIFDKDH